MLPARVGRNEGLLREQSIVMPPIVLSMFHWEIERGCCVLELFELDEMILYTFVLSIISIVSPRRRNCRTLAAFHS
jgi:hypothetical protein